MNSPRFLAALFVLFHHAGVIFFPYLDSASFPSEHRFGAIFFDSLGTSVSFFFLLSGYSLSLAYLKKGHIVDSRKFLVSRFSRVCPLYLLVLVLNTPHLLHFKIQRLGLIPGLDRTAEVFAANVLMIQAWRPQSLLLINIPSWSLCAEALFYLCFPILGPLLWKLRGARIWIAAIALYAGGQALVWALRPHIALELVYRLPLLHLSSFALGVVLARWHSLEKERIGPAGVKAWQANTVLALSLAALFVCVLLSPLFHVRWPYYNGLLAPVFAAMIWSLSATPTLASRFLCRKWLAALGNSSFALYMIHFPILQLFKNHNWVAIQFFPLYVGLCIALGILSFHFFEAPVRIWLTERFESRRLAQVRLLQTSP
jgi:peptidoglycan/LPS O-acetylase OafA/YrhL